MRTSDLYQFLGASDLALTVFEGLRECLTNAWSKASAYQLSLSDLGATKTCARKVLKDCMACWLSRCWLQALPRLQLGVNRSAFPARQWLAGRGPELLLRTTYKCHHQALQACDLDAGWLNKVQSAAPWWQILPKSLSL